MQPDPTPRVEQEFHDQMWGLANDASRIERAVSDARQLCYAVLAKSGDDTLRYQAEEWLAANGRDAWREAQAAHASAHETPETP